MSDTAEKKTATPKTKVAQENLYANGWVIAYPEGAEVPVSVLDGDLAKEYDWASKVK